MEKSLGHFIDVHGYGRCNEETRREEGNRVKRADEGGRRYSSI